MTPEEEQKLRNFRLLGGGSSMELPQQQQPIASILGQAGSGGFGTNPNQFFGPGFGFRNRMAKDGVMAYRADTGERALDFEENAVRNYANMGNRSPQLNMPTITAQVPGIENITLGQAPIVSQEGIQYQTPERGGADMNVKESIADAWNESVLGQKMKGAFGQQAFGVGNDQYQIRNKFFGIVGDQIPYSEASPQAKSEAMKAYFLGGITERPVGQTYEQAVAQQEEQVAPTIQSIAGVEQAQEQAQEQAPRPEATFTLPSGEVRSIMPGQDVASAFGRESGKPITFQVDGGEVTVPSAQAIQTMNLGEQAAARQAQQEFLASPAASEMSNRMLRSVMYNDPYAQASAERVARMEAKPDFMRAVSDRERRGTGEMSMASATKLTGGDRDKARAMIELQRQGRDPMTGKEVEAPFEPKEIEISGNKYIQLTPNYFQPIKEDTPEKTGLQSSLDDLQADFQSGRLTKEQFDLAVENITNTYIGRNKGKPEGGVVSEIEKIIAAGEGDSVDSTFTPQQEAGIEAVMNTNKITREAAIQALKEAGKLN
jgi:hypothetical protein